jgi:hypothetical protein
MTDRRLTTCRQTAYRERRRPGYSVDGDGRVTI